MASGPRVLAVGARHVDRAGLDRSAGRRVDDLADEPGRAIAAAQLERFAAGPRLVQQHVLADRRPQLDAERAVVEAVDAERAVGIGAHAALVEQELPRARLADVLEAG